MSRWSLRDVICHVPLVITMGKFNPAYRLASDPTLPLPVRYLKFIEACSAFGCIANSRLQPTHDALGQRFGFSRDQKPDGTQISLALAAMVQVRFRLLHLLSEARAQKRKRKAASDRRKQQLPFTEAEVLFWLQDLPYPKAFFSGVPKAPRCEREET